MYKMEDLIFGKKMLKNKNNYYNALCDYLKGKTRREVSKENNISNSSFDLFLDYNKISKNKPTIVSYDKCEKALKEYLQGEAYTVVCNKYCIGKNNFKKFLKLKKINIRNDTCSILTSKKKQNTIKQKRNKKFFIFLSQYLQGESRTSLAIKNHFDLKSFNKFLKENNIEIRSDAYTEKTFNKIKMTMFNKYGVDNYFKLKDKIQESYIKKYNVDNPKKLLWVNEKTKKTMKQRYGVEHNWNNGILREKEKQTWIEKYKVDNPLKSKLVRNKLNQTLQEKSTHYSFYISNDEKELREFIESLGFIAGKDFICRNRSVIGEELDFYFPELKIAIEYNGVYWHNFNRHPSIKFHYNKMIKCREKGIDLIMVWEDHWKNKNEIIKNVIKHRLKKSTCYVQARKCEIREIDNETYKQFCIENHIQGYRTAFVKLGLFYNNELKQIASFGHNKKYQWEWIRGCVSSNNLIVGGVDRLFKYFVKNWKPQSILCYSDNNYFNGNGYEKIGFELVDEIKNDKFYIENNRGLKRIARNPFKYQELMQKVKDKKLFLCYGCGSKKFLWRAK